MAGMPPIRSDCPGPQQPGQGVRSWALALFCSSVQKCSVKSRGQTQRLSSCPSWGGHCCSSGLRACGTSHHRSVAAQQTQDAVMTWRCVRPSKELNLLPVHSKESWNSPVGLHPDTGQWHILSSGMLSAVLCYLNGQPFRNTECWNAPQAKMAEKNLPGLLWTVPAHIPAMSVAKMLIVYRGTCSNSPSVLHHLPSWGRTHPFNLSELHGEQLSASSEDEGIELSRLELNTLIKPLLSNHFYQTTSSAQHKAATAQKQEGNALPHLSLTSSCPVKHKEHKGCVRESSRLMWLRKDFILDTSSIKDTSRV